MITIPGYRIDGELYTNSHTAIYRGMQLEEQKPVILKTLTLPYPTPAQIAQLLHESEILKNLNLPGIFKLYKIEKYNHFPVLVLEDFGGISLKDFLSHNELELQQFLQIGIKLAETIGQLHEHTSSTKILNPAILLSISRQEMSRLLILRSPRCYQAKIKPSAIPIYSKEPSPICLPNKPDA